jgi:hypothetical protein
MLAKETNIVAGAGAITELLSSPDWKNHPIGASDTWPAALWTAF